MKDLFTPEQRSAVEAGVGDTLVSAAAGSGKTTVLSARVCKRIAQDKASCDRMLIVTFTNASASDMRTKICKRLREEYDATHDRHLWREYLRVPYAKICTIDSFTVSILREFFREADVAPNFTVLDKTEQSFYENKILAELLEEYYTAYPEGMDEMLALFGGEGENERLEDAIGTLYDILKTVPFPAKWLDEKKALYTNPDKWEQALCEELKPLFYTVSEEYRRALDRADFKDACRDVLSAELGCLEDLCKSCDASDYEGLVQRLDTADFSGKISCGKSIVEQVRLREYRDLLREKLANMHLFKPYVLSALRRDLSSQKKGISMLFETVREYMTRMSKEYKLRNKYPFDEISAKVLALVCSQTDGWEQETEVGAQIRGRYDEIMIDEYQDVNDRQDMFFRAISRNNRFVVGDVKQSIYGFRHANPDNFLDKEKTFNTIGLARNFRSRKGVLAFSNFLFERLFSPSFGGVSYGEKEKLVYGSTYPESETPDVATVMLKVPNLNAANDDRIAYAIAGEAKRLVESGMQVYTYNKKEDRAVGRPIRYSDICLLMRNKTQFDTYRTVFAACGVPLYAAGGISFFETPEVNTVLMLLSVLANPYSDIDLFGVMTSSLYGFSAEEIAQIRLAERKKRLWSAAMKYAQTDKKTRAFTEDISRLRLLAENLPIHRLIHHIYIEREYLSVVSYGEHGAGRRENLMKLYKYAKRYEDSADGSISSFLAFVQRALEKKEKDTDASVPQGNFVHLVTIHTSKGLEYPVCFVVPTSRTSRAGKTSHCFADGDLGFGAWVRTENMASERPTVMSELIRLRKERSEAEEELRLLYVAMTRAKEKLYVVMPCQAKEEALTEVISGYYATADNDRVNPIWLRYGPSEKEILLRALCRHASFRGLTGELGTSYITTEEPFGLSLEDSALPTAESTVTEALPTAGLSQAEIERRFSYRYPNPLDHVPAGLSVTELIKHAAVDTEYRNLIDSVPDCEPPAFLRQEKLTPSQRGSAVHLFCEKADLTKNPREELKRLVDTGSMTEEQAKAVDLRKINDFTQSALFGELSRAEYVRREEAFLISVPSELYDENAKTGSLLLQGAMDAVYEYADGVIVLDFKTDRCAEDELVRRYAKQLKLYAVAAEKIFEKPVFKTVIWSFHLSKAVEIS